MKRMFLVSMFQTVSNLLKTIEPDLKNKTVTYIPTASKVEKLGFFVKISKWKLKRLGLAVDELEVSEASYEMIVSKLEKNDILIREIEKGKLYIGESAGAIIAAPDIGYSAKMDRAEKAPDLREYSGLNLIDFYVVPHYKNWEMGKAAKEIIHTYSNSLDLKIIRDTQAILVEDKKVRILDKQQKR